MTLDQIQPMYNKSVVVQNKLNFFTQESFLQHMNITIKRGLFNLIKVGNYVQQTIKG